MTHLSTRFARRPANHDHRAQSGISSPKNDRLTSLAAGVLLAFLLAVIMLLWTMPQRTLEEPGTKPDASTGISRPDTVPGSPWVSGRSADPRQLRRFRFPDEPYGPLIRNHDWYTLGANHQAGGSGARIILGASKHRILHFSFDDGPSLATTARILDMLSEYNIRATFFVLGKNLYGPDSEAHRELLRELDKNGHTVALHSYTHNDLRSLSDAQIHRELRRSEHMLNATLGYRPGLFRPPYGGRSERTSSLLQDRGYTEILWNIAPEEYGARTAWEVVSNFHAALNEQEQNGYGPGGIVLLHDNRGTTADALPFLLEELRARNCVLLDQDVEELWDVVGDLSYFLFYGERMPEGLLAQRQKLARQAAEGYCTATDATQAPERDRRSLAAKAD